MKISYVFMFGNRAITKQKYIIVYKSLLSN